MSYAEKQAFKAYIYSLKVKLDEAQGRKARVSGTVEDMSGNVLVQAKCARFLVLPSQYPSQLTPSTSALFVQPRYAKLLNSSAVRHMLGEPSHSKEPIAPGTTAPVPVKLPGGAQTLVETKA